MGKETKLLKEFSLDLNERTISVKVGHGMQDLDTYNKGIIGSTFWLTDARLLDIVYGLGVSAIKYIDQDKKKRLSVIHLTDELDERIIQVKRLMKELQQDQKELEEEREQSHKRSIKSMNKVK